jgi:hypothetical protein
MTRNGRFVIVLSVQAPTGLAHPRDILVAKAIKTDAMLLVALPPDLRGGCRFRRSIQSVQNNADRF